VEGGEKARQAQSPAQLELKPEEAAERLKGQEALRDFRTVKIRIANWNRARSQTWKPNFWSFAWRFPGSAKI
jgi:hypothetical protein